MSRPVKRGGRVQSGWAQNSGRTKSADRKNLKSLDAHSTQLHRVPPWIGSGIDAVDPERCRVEYKQPDERVS